MRIFALFNFLTYIIMSKRSLFWSQATGKLGDIVLARRKGETIARAYVAQPANPKTQPQMRQRILFANAVKFYKDANANYFKFAYEDKKPQESDYNAFMRHNVVEKSTLLKMAQVKGNFPAVGKNWIIANGSLNGASYDGEDTQTPALVVTGASASTLTVGDLSTLLKSTYGLVSDDIVTIVKIRTLATTVYEDSYPYPAPEWIIRQFRVDENDTTTLHDIDVDFVCGTDKMTLETTQGVACWCGVVFSRQTANGLKVSDAMLIGNDFAKILWDESQDAGWQLDCLASWGASQLAILQGGALPQEGGTQAPFLVTLTANNISVPNGGSSPVLANTAYNFTAQGRNLAALTADDITIPSGATLSNFTAAATELAFTVTFGTVGGDISIGENFTVTAVMTSPASSVTSIAGQTNGGSIQARIGANSLEYVANGPILASQIEYSTPGYLSVESVTDDTMVINLTGAGTLYVRDANDSSLTIFTLGVAIAERVFITVYSVGNGTVAINDGEQSRTQVQERLYVGDTCEIIARPDEANEFAGWTRHGGSDVISTDETYEFTIEGGVAYDAHFREVE